jgi:hypothetical protein
VPDALEGSALANGSALADGSTVRLGSLKADADGDDATPSGPARPIPRAISAITATAARTIPTDLTIGIVRRPVIPTNRIPSA